MTLHEKITRAVSKVSFFNNSIAIAEKRIKHYSKVRKAALVRHDKVTATRAGRRLKYWNSDIKTLAKAQHTWLTILHKLRKIARGRKHTYGAGGWAPTSTWWIQRVDQGQDFEIPLGERVRAPGDGEVVGRGQDAAFPNGFGEHAIVRIDTGRFGGRTYYIGHAEGDLAPVGTRFKTGDPLSRTNHYLTPGRGWVELGTYPYGSMGTGWNIHGLFTDVTE